MQFNKQNFNARGPVLALALVALPTLAWSAGGHYPVDDADITGAGEWQIESWFSRLDSDTHEQAVLLATTLPGTRLELTGGLYQQRGDGQTDYWFEPAAKWRLTADDEAPLMVAASLALAYEGNGISDWLFNIPVTYRASRHDLTWHGNVGWIRERNAGAAGQDLNRVFLGAGLEWGFSEPVSLVAQWYREGADAEPEAQLGLRWAFDHPIELLDVAMARPLRGDDKDWALTVGLTVTF